jgi:hypothetical protein
MTRTVDNGTDQGHAGDRQRRHDDIGEPALQEACTAGTYE